MNQTDHPGISELHDASLKVTPARLGVLDILEQSTAPIDATTIKAYLKKHRLDVDEATVFRILSKFAQKGIAKPIQFNEGKTRYEYAGKPSHHHFVCNSCGSVTDIMGCILDPLERTIERSKGVKITRHSLEFFGLCKQCL